MLIWQTLFLLYFSLLVCCFPVFYMKKMQKLKKLTLKSEQVLCTLFAGQNTQHLVFENQYVWSAIFIFFSYSYFILSYNSFPEEAFFRCTFKLVTLHTQTPLEISQFIGLSKHFPIVVFNIIKVYLQINFIRKYLKTFRYKENKFFNPKSDKIHSNSTALKWCCNCPLVSDRVT